jgi:hypothetical protein
MAIRGVLWDLLAKDHHDPATVTLDQFGFGLPIAGTDAAYEISRIAGIARGCFFHSR